MTPAYTAKEIKEMCKAADFDYESFKILVELIEKEIELYPPEDLRILSEASILAMNRGLLNKLFKR